MATDISTFPPVAQEPARRLWTRDEYYRLGEQGFFDGQRVELIEGEIVVLSPQGIRHVIAIHLVVEALQKAIGSGFWIRTQAPLDLSEISEPEPDVSVVPGSPRDYHQHPRTALLAVEVSDSTRSYDLRRKAKLYAASQGIPEYWVVDLVDRVLYTMRDPQNGEYQTILRATPGESVQPASLPSKAIAVQDLFP